MLRSGPVDLEAFAGAGLDANVSSAGGGFSAQGTEIVFDDGLATLIAQRAQPLGEDGHRDGRVLLEQLGDRRLERFQFAGVVAA